MRFFTVICFFLLSFSIHAQSPADLAKLAEGMKLDKTQVSGMIDMMVKMGKISKEDAKKAKAELGKYSDEDMQALQHQAVDKIKSTKGQPGGGMGSIVPTQGEILSAPIRQNAKSPASSDAPSSSSKTKVPGASEPGYKEALDYLNQ